MSTNRATLYYIHDPMCSWCWGFRPTWLAIESMLPKDIKVEYILGGLATDSNKPMPLQMRATIRTIWEKIQQHIPETPFNFDFWDTCIPRRSTYPACRAILAAKKQKTSAASAMTFAIQKAYYLQAQNPSDDSVLIELANKLSLDADLFAQDLNSQPIHKQLMDDIHHAQSLGAQGFPSLILKMDDNLTLIKIDYNDPRNVLHQIVSICH